MKNQDKLVSLAAEARKKAHAPYSNFNVGAALLARSGRVYTGCNVENASYGLSVCAERVAVFKAVSEGEREFEAIAVVSENGITPCGACRQVLMEFGDDIRVIVADTAGHRRAFALTDLLPEAFTSDDLP
jgi:cytidine deaminase